MTIVLPGDAGVLNEATRTVDLAILAVAKDAKDATVGKLNENAGGQFPPEAVAQIKEIGFQLSALDRGPGWRFHGAFRHS